MRDLVGKTAFVTGGASGIGLAVGRPRPCAGRDERFNLLAPKANSHREDGEGGQTPVSIPEFLSAANAMEMPFLFGPSSTRRGNMHSSRHRGKHPCT